MDMTILLQVIYYTIMVIVASATVAKLVAKSVASASATVVESNVAVIKEAMRQVETERNHDHRLEALEQTQVEMDERMSQQYDELREQIEAGNHRVETRLDKLYELLVPRGGTPR